MNKFKVGDKVIYNYVNGPKCYAHLFRKVSTVVKVSGDYIYIEEFEDGNEGIFTKRFRGINSYISKRIISLNKKRGT